MTSSDAVAFIGLGLMGGTMTAHLLAEGHEVIGFDPEPERCAEHQARGGSVAATAADASAGAGVSILSLPNSNIMLEVCGQIAGTAEAGHLVIDTTTGDPAHAREAAAVLGAADIGYVDATISGNGAQAKTKDIIFIVGGAADHVARASSLLGVLGRGVHSVGPVGAGATAKLVVNHVLSINRSALAEGLVAAEKAGLDLEPMLAVLRDSAAYSKAIDLWGERMVNADHDPPASRIRQGHKDSRLINDHADLIGASHALVAAVRTVLEEAEAGGLSDADQSAVIEVMRRRANIGRLS